MPADVRQALAAAKLMAAYKARPAYQQNDYIGWITRAKLASARERRKGQMLTELKGHDRYMKMPYRARLVSH
jgi:hypothetical protein